MDLDKAFGELNRGIDFIDRDMADDAKRQRLTQMLEKALAAYKAGDELGGAELVQQFQGSIFRQN